MTLQHIFQFAYKGGGKVTVVPCGHKAAVGAEEAPCFAQCGGGIHQMQAVEERHQVGGTVLEKRMFHFGSHEFDGCVVGLGELEGAGEELGVGFDADYVEATPGKFNAATAFGADGNVYAGGLRFAVWVWDDARDGLPDVGRVDGAKGGEDVGESLGWVVTFEGIELFTGGNWGIQSSFWLDKIPGIVMFMVQGWERFKFVRRSREEGIAYQLLHWSRRNYST